jgi:hypothetical protein
MRRSPACGGSAGPIADRSKKNDSQLLAQSGGMAGAPCAALVWALMPTVVSAPQPLSGGINRVASAYTRRRQLEASSQWCGFWGESWPEMLGAPFRSGATHVMQLGPVAVAHVHDQVVNDTDKVGGGPFRLASKP